MELSQLASQLQKHTIRGHSESVELLKLLLRSKAVLRQETRYGFPQSLQANRPWGPPSLLYNGYRVFTGGNAAGAWR
jgi:hypothetical protein